MQLKSLTCSITPENFFTNEDLKDLFALPYNTICCNETMNSIQFKNSIKSLLPNISHIKVIEILKPLTPLQITVQLIVFSGIHSNVGFFINSSRHDDITALLTNLYSVAPEKSQAILERYLKHCVATANVENINRDNKFVFETFSLMDYLNNNNICFDRKNIDYSSLYQLSEQDIQKKCKSILKKMKKSIKSFDSYVGMNILPAMLDKNYMIYNYLSEDLYVVKPQDSGVKFYCINLNSILPQHQNFANYFYLIDSISGQKYYHLLDNINESHLIGEVENNTIVKASNKLLNFNVLQHQICSELYKEKKLTHYSEYLINSEKKSLSTIIEKRNIDNNKNIFKM